MNQNTITIETHFENLGHNEGMEEAVRLIFHILLQSTNSLPEALGVLEEAKMVYRETYHDMIDKNPDEEV